MNLNNDDIAILAQASLFRKIRAISRTMQKTEWTFYGLGRRIRTKDNVNCPLSFVRQTGSSHNWELAASKLGLTNRQSIDIIRAADSYIVNQPRIQKLRRILLKSAKLNENTNR